MSHKNAIIMAFLCLSLSALCQPSLPRIPIATPTAMSPKLSAQKTKPAFILLAVVSTNNPPVTVAWTISTNVSANPSVLLAGSTDLVNWIDLGFFTDTTGNYSYTDTNHLPSRFYRAMAVGSLAIVTNLTTSTN